MITIDNLFFSYNKRKSVLEQINLHLQAGKIYGLLGENGAGKTTLLKGIAGLVFPKTGKIDVLGFEPGRREPAFLSEIFVIPEDFILPSISIKRYLQLLAPFYRKFDHTLFYQLIKEFDLPQEANLESLSFGQRKKVLISFGLATRTRILLMDEPTNGLDIPSKSQFRKIISRELTDDRCFIISTHQVRDLDNLIDILVILSKKTVGITVSMDMLGETFVFKAVNEYSTDILYAEPSINGLQAILPNDSGIPAKVDIELFFKAFLLEEEKIINLLNKQTIATNE